MSHEEMSLEYVLGVKNLKKRYKRFALEIPHLAIPKGFSTALIGENGAGKTTLLNILSGIRLDYRGEITYFGEYNDKDREENPQVKERIGYTGPGAYYLPKWRVNQIADISEMLFENFHRDRFEEWCRKLAITGVSAADKVSVDKLSDGNRMKLMLAGVLARDTELLLLDEPASPLDPLMRDCLCGMIRSYLAEGEGERSVFFSTHNISDMESATDYAVIMAQGKIAEAGFVEDLKEKYVLVKGDRETEAAAREHLFSVSVSPYGFEGIALAKQLDALAGLCVDVETPTLFQISVAVMKEQSVLLSE